jgi:hypothetical protein
MINYTMSYFILGIVVALAAMVLAANIAAFGDGEIYDRNDGYIGRTDGEGIIYDRLDRRVGRIEHRGGCND